MHIRLQLALLMAAVVTPAALVAVPSYLSFFDAQRQVQVQRFQERVSGLRLALENEQRHTLNMLEGYARTAPLAARNVGQAGERLARLVELNPSWSALVLIDVQDRDKPDREVARAARSGTPPGLQLDAPTLEKTLRNKRPAVSDLVSLPGGRHHYTYFAAPVTEDDRVVGVLYAVVDHLAWLNLLRTYPIAKDATLTLNDSDGTIVARTLNHEQWVGKPSKPSYWLRTIGKQQGSFENLGLEGQSFYTAFSRLGTSDWVLGTGVPAATVEEALVAPAALSLGGLLLTLAVAGGVAVLLTRRITSSLDHLAAVASSDSGEPLTQEQARLPLAEAEEVRHRLQEAIANERRGRTAAEHASREKDAFLAMLAHELRNPLSAIKAAVAILGNPRANHDAQTRAKEVLDRQVRQMAEMVNAMLDAARLSAGKVSIERVPVDLAASLRRVVGTFEQTRRTAHLEVRLSLCAARVEGDETRLEQVFANLLDNAAKYTPPGGLVCITSRMDGPVVEVRFEDTGSGIEPGLLPHVFDAFSQDARTLDRSQGGLGLGLSVVKEVVGLHGGTVRAESAGAGRGASFVVRLPALAETPSAPTSTAASAGTSGSTVLKPLRIAVVDDNRDNAETVAGLLRLAGHQVATAYDGPGGMALVQAQPSEVALIDIGMPGMDGLEVARQLKGAGVRTLLIAFSGYGDEKIRQRMREAGFDGYLQKPFDAAHFQQAVLTAWDAGQRREALRAREGSAPSS